METVSPTFTVSSSLRSRLGPIFLPTYRQVFWVLASSLPVPENSLGDISVSFRRQKGIS